MSDLIGESSIFLAVRNTSRYQEIQFRYRSVTPVAGSIFRPLSRTQRSGSEFSDEILRSALLDIQPTFKCPLEWIHVIPPLVRLDEVGLD